MYPPTSSSSPSPPNQEPLPSGLTRYGSAPGSFLTRAVESVIGPGREYTAASQQQQASSSSLVGHYFTGETSSETTCKVNAVGSDLNKEARGGLSSGLQRSYGFNDVMNAGGCSLVRQKSSPAGFLSHLVSENGFSITRGGSYNGSTNGPTNGHAPSRLKPQLSFTRQDSLSQISEVSESLVEGLSSEHGRRVSSSSYQEGSFRMDPWESSGNIAFSGSPSKKLKTIDGDFYNYGLETQFSLPQTTLEMAAAEKFMHIPEDSVPCKIRAKRGCATHPRSIAERERRTRISGKLKKLQDLVPNMDKQSSYADMLDLAVQHIKGLQQEVNRLHKEMGNCTCGSKTAK